MSENITGAGGIPDHFYLFSTHLKLRTVLRIFIQSYKVNVFECKGLSIDGIRSELEWAKYGHQMAYTPQAILFVTQQLAVNLPILWLKKRSASRYWQNNHFLSSKKPRSLPSI